MRVKRTRHRVRVEKVKLCIQKVQSPAAHGRNCYTVISSGLESLLAMIFISAL